MKPLRITASYVALCLLAACGLDGAEPGNTSDGLQQAQDAPALATYESALGAFPYLGRAEGELIRRCMAEQGYEYYPAPPPPSLGQKEKTLSVAQARRDGYASLLPPAEAPGAYQEELYLRSLSEADREGFYWALFGNSSDRMEVEGEVGKLTIPTDGCQTQAEQHIYGDRTTWAQLHFVVMNLQALQGSDSQDQQLQEATGRWASCIRERGHEFNSPAESIEAAAEASGGDLDDAQAIKLAVDDAICRNETDWDAVNAAASQRTLAALTQRYEGEILAYYEIQLEAMGRAQQVLGQ